ncbi:TPA: AAA family ATPase [Serratia marcescens]|nr:AAA family ATPase [Serratia marcescens]
MEFYFSTRKDIADKPGIYLMQDNIDKGWGNPWNDFGHVMLFTVYYKTDKSEVYRLGNIRVLSKDFLDTASHFKKNGIALDDKTIDITSVLNIDDVVSLPEKNDFYQAVNKVFSTKNEIRLYLRGICDASYLKQMKSTHETWEGYTGALFRDSSSKDAILMQGASIALGHYKIKNELSISIDSLSEGFESFEFSFFNSERDSHSSDNVNLLIGKNGIGKTHILKHLADMLTGIKDTINRPYINKVVVVAYSPFEDFKLKDDIVEELKEKYKDNFKDITDSEQLLDVNDYAYIGFKNKNGVFDKNAPEQYGVKALRSILIQDGNDWWREVKKFNTLRNTLSSAICFDKLGVYKVNGDFVEVSNEIIDLINIPESELDLTKGISFIFNDEKVNLSSGQVIFSCMIPSIISEITDESLLIIDEPELYLHPTLEVALISMLKRILKVYSSYAIIATHSAVMAREIKSGCVKVLKNKGSKTLINPPSIETYGESLDQIIGEVFDDYRTVKPFQVEIDNILESSNDKASVIKELSDKIGDEALIYLTSKMQGGDDELIMEPLQ